MAISEDEYLNIVNAVVQSIRTNSLTIGQLIPVVSLKDTDTFEIDGGKKVTYGVLKSLIAALSQSEIDALVSKINKCQLVSCDVTATDKSATLTIRSVGKTIATTIPIATTTTVGLMTPSEKTLLASVGKANGIAPLGPDGKVPTANLPASTGSAVKEVINFAAVVDDVEAVHDSTAMSSTSNRCSVVYDSVNKIFLLRYLRISSGGGELGGGELPFNPAEQIMPVAAGELGEGEIVAPSPTLVPEYYRSWADAGDFGSVTAAGVKPVTGRIYVCAVENSIYITSGSELVCIKSGTAAAGEYSLITKPEIDTMFEQ